MSTLPRKLQLLRMLRDSPDGVRLKDAAERLEVSKLTVKRDLDELSRSAIPIGERREGQTDLFFLCDEGASLPPLPARLGARELAGLEAARAALSPYRPSPLVGELDAVQSKLSGSATRRPSRFTGNRRQALLAAPASVLDTLLEAILGARRCELVYEPRWAKAARRYEVEPLGLRLADGLIYLEARVPPHKNVALFVTHRLREARLCEATFRRPKRRTWTAFGVFEGEPTRVEVRFHPDVAVYIAERRWHPTQKLTREAGDFLVFRARLSGRDEFIGWVMSWGGLAELVRPLEWRKALRERAQRLQAAHG